MDAAAFGALVQRLERSAAAAPAVYRARVTGLAVLGYAYILSILALLAIVTAVLVVVMVEMRSFAAVKVLLPLLVVIGAVLQALWVKFSPPEGLPLRRDDAPALFELARDVARHLRAPRVHTIVAVPDLNAAVMQVPRLGPFGWYRNYLIVGLPLLQAVPPEEWRSILAHEMGHLSGSHGRFGAWIYRLRSTWSRLLETLEQGGSGLGKVLFRGFVNWYAPYFNAYTFVLARAHEYQADAASAELVGPETARRALMRIEIAGQQAAAFWSGLYEGVSQAPEPPPDSQQRLRAALQTAPNSDDAAAWVDQAWRQPTEYADTHPALADRLKALGWPSGDGGPPPPPPEPFTGPSAAEHYLGEAQARIAEYCEEVWVRGVEGAWRNRHAEVMAMRRRLAELDGATAALSSQDEWERMRLCEELGDTERAGELAERLLEREPTHTGVRLRVAVRRLERGDPGAVETFEQLMRDDPRTVGVGCSILIEHFESLGDGASVERYRARAEEGQRQLELADIERATVIGVTEFQPHGLDSDTVSAVRRQLEQYQLREAYLARRAVKHLPELPCYVLAVVPHRRWWRWLVTKEEVALRDAIARDVASLTPYVYLAVNQLAGLRRKLRAVPGARLL